MTQTRRLEMEDLYAIPTPSDPRLSPDGSQVAYVVTAPNGEDDRYDVAIWVADVAGVDGPAPRRLTAGRSDGAPRWSPDGRTLAFLAARQDAKPQLHLLPLDGGEARALTSLPLGAGAGVWSPSGDRLAFIAPVDIDPDRGPGAPLVVDRLGYKADGAGLIGSLRTHLFVVAVDGDSATLQLTEGDWNAGMPAWSPDGTSIVIVGDRGVDRDIAPSSSLLRVPAGGGQPQALTDDQGVIAAPFFLTPTEIVFAGSTDYKPGHTTLFLLDITDGVGGKPTPLAETFDRNVMVGAPGYPGGAPAGGVDRSIVFCARDRGCTHIFAVHPEEGDVSRVAGGWDRTISGLSVGAAVGLLAFVASTPTSPGEVFVAALDGADERCLTNLCADALPDVALYKPEDRTFKAHDGTEIHGWVVRDPEVGPNAPMLLDIHGGPHNAWGPSFDGVHPYHQVLAAQGWVIVYLNPRGSDGYGEAFYTSVVGGWGQADLGDFLGAVDSLVADGTVDPQRLAVTGYSYGGYMTCRLTASTDRFAAAVPGGVVVDLAAEFGTADMGWYLGVLEVGATPTEDPARYVAVSPISDVDQVTAPTLILHGEADQRCPIGQAEQWFAGLRARRVPCQLVRYPGGSHLFLFNGTPSHRVDYGRRLIDWVTRYAGTV